MSTTDETPHWTIYDMGAGDYVRGIGGKLYEIKYVEAQIDQPNPLHFQNWTIVTIEGARISKIDCATYHKRTEITHATR